MSTDLDRIDLAANMSRLAAKLDKIAANMRNHASGLVIGWATPENADALADVLDETARQVRLNRPGQPQEEPCPESTWKSADPATALDSRTGSRTVLPVEASDKSPSASKGCDHCDGGGVMRWKQPEPDGDGGMLLREMEHPCPRPGCGPGWKHPHAERDRVVAAPNDAPARAGGQAAAANKLPDALGEELLQIYARFSRDE